MLSGGATTLAAFASSLGKMHRRQGAACQALGMTLGPEPLYPIGDQQVQFINMIRASRPCEALA
eukprot:9470915-Pyramimonas_sp.AAC.1